MCDATSRPSLDLEKLGAYLHVAVPRVAGTLLERDRGDAGAACPRCGLDLARLTLSWGEHWATIESCDGCALLLLERGEVEELVAMVRAAARLLGSRPLSSRPTGGP